MALVCYRAAEVEGPSKQQDDQGLPACGISVYLSMHQLTSVVGDVS